jgi:hypothetical protein
MARPKKAAVVKKQKPKKDPRIQQVYEEEVTFMCPKRGLVKQKVKIKRYKTLEEQTNKHLVATIDEITAKLDETDDGLSIYSDGEELGITGIPEEGEQ